jgi:indolepyruvate ferredoxin oxidoreductase beta subunit
LTEALVHAGFDVKKSEVHGMAQRGGSVLTHVRFGPKVYSPLVKKGEGDILLSFEQLETLRYLDYLSPDPTIFLNEQKITPPSVSMGLEAYPEDITGHLKQRFKNTFLVEGLLLARKAGNIKAVNTVLLGALSRCLPVDERTWLKTMRERFPKPLQPVNIEGFHLGRGCQAAG